MPDGDDALEAPPPHSVQLTVKVNYVVDKSSVPYHVHRLNELKQQGVISKVILKKEDYIHSFFATFCGPSVEGRSPPLFVEASSWSATHTVNVDVPLIEEYLRNPFELCIFETVKVPAALSTDRGDKSKSTGVAKVKVNLANTGLTNTQQRLRRAKRSKDTTEKDGQETVSSDQPNEVASGRPFSVLSSLPNHEHERASSVIKTAQSTIPVGYKHINEILSSKVSTRANTATPDDKGHAKSRARPSSKLTQKNTRGRTSARHSPEDDRSNKETPHPHHSDHPERYTSPGSGLRRSRSALSLSSLSHLVNRPKTPPQPHHFDHPISTLFPRRARSGSVGKELNRNEDVKKAAASIDPFDLHQVMRRDFGLNQKEVFTSSKESTGEDDKTERHDSEEKRHQPVVTFRVKSADSVVSRTYDALNLDAASGTQKSRKTRFSDEDKHEPSHTIADSLLDSDSIHYVLAYKEDKVKKERRGQFTLESRKFLVGRIHVDLTPFVLGETRIEKRCDSEIHGLSSLTCEVRIDQTFLSSGQQTSLNPLAIIIDKAESMPSRPISFKHLDELCSPTSARFRFYDWPTSYMVQQRAPHGNKATFKSTHVILLGLLEEEKLKERLCTGSFVVEMHDRQVCSDGHRFDVERGEYCPTCPFGEARFDLADIAKGANYLRLRSPILPGKRSLNCCIPPGLWVEFGTSLSLKISLPFAPNSIPDSRTRLFDRPFFRAVLLLPANMVKESELVENIINTSNSESLYICTDDVNARRQALLSLTLGEELDSPLLDVISGFCFYDKAYRIYTFECANGPAFKRLHEAFSSFANGTHWEYWPCHKRIWQPASAGIVYVHLKESLFSSAKIPRNYIQGNIAGSYDCLTFLFNLAAMRNHMPIYLNCKVPSITDIFEFVHAFGEFVDFTESLGSDEEEGGCSFEDIAKQPSGYVPWKPVMSKIDDKNPEFKKSLEQRKRVHMDFIAIYNKNYPQTGIPRLRERFGKKVHNYSIQKLSTASLELNAIRSRMKKNTSYYYSKPFDLPLGPLRVD